MYRCPCFEAPNPACPNPIAHAEGDALRAYNRWMRAAARSLTVGTERAAAHAFNTRALAVAAARTLEEARA